MLTSFLRRPLYIFIVCILLAFAIFGGFLNNEFHFDDYSSIVNNTQLENPENLFHELLSHPFQIDRLFTSLTFSLNRATHGLWTPGFAVVNIVLHGSNAFILFLVLLQLLPHSRHDATELSLRPKKTDNASTITALSVACLFLAHPLAVNTVSYITQRHGLLTTLFYLVGFYCFLLQRQTTSWSRLLCWLGVFIAFLFGMHSKPTIVTMPAVCILYDLIFPSNNRRTPIYSPKHHWLNRKIFSYLLIGIGIALLLILYGMHNGLFASADSTAGYANPALGSYSQTFLTQSEIVLRYLGLLLLPLPQFLCADRDYPLATHISAITLGAWSCHFALMAAAVFCYRKRLYLVAFGTAWYYLTLLPFMVLPIQDRMVDYRTYLPSVGFFMVMSQVSFSFVQRYCRCSQNISPALTGKAFPIFLAFFAGYCVSGVYRNLSFISEISFWSDVIEKNPSRPRSYNNRGLAWMRQSDYDRAAIDFNTAIRTAGGYPLAYGNAGDVYLKQGKTDAALQYYHMYNRIRPEDPEGFLRLGNGYSAKQKWQEALENYLRAQDSLGDDVRILYSLSLAYQHLGKSDQAETILRRLLKQQPTHVPANGNLGVVLYQTGRTKEAQQVLEKALQIDPSYVPARINLIASYANNGDVTMARRLAEALAEYDPARARSLLQQLEVQTPK